MTKRIAFSIAFTLLLVCTLALDVGFQPVKSESSVCVKVAPEAVYSFPGGEFTVAVVVEDVGQLYGLQIDMSWNATLLDYVSHTVAIPVENHSNGILHETALIFNDYVDPALGTYEIASACLYDAPSFNGSGKVFKMTFVARTTGTCVLHIFVSVLVDIDCRSIDHSVSDGTVSIGVTIRGDVDRDFDVDIYDMVKILRAYGSREGDVEYLSECDIDRDKDVDIFDAVIAAKNYGMKIL